MSKLVLAIGITASVRADGFLSIFEARGRVLRTTDVVRSIAARECPIAELTAVVDGGAIFWVYTSCGERARNIGHFRVDRLKGTVWVGAEFDRLAEMDAKVSPAVLVSVQEQTLTVLQAKCIVVSTLASTEAASQSCLRVTHSFDSLQESFFDASIQCDKGSSDWIGSFSVDRTSGAVVSLRSGKTITSDRGAALRQKLLTNSTDVELDRSEAKSIVENSGALRRAKYESTSSCGEIKVVGGRDGYPIGAYRFDLIRDCGIEKGSIVESLAVSPSNGDLQSITTGRNEADSATARLAETFLSRHRSHVELERRKVNAECELLP